MDVAAYLERIRYRDLPALDAETLRQLHEAHLLAVPFENLSIHWGEPIELADEALFDKVVVRRRGGFCYELNGLFAALLRSLGFEVVMLSAGVMRASGDFSPDFDHMALLVNHQERWLVDVGFGDLFRQPLRLDERGPQIQDGSTYRIDPDEEGRMTLLRSDGDGPWNGQYRFSLEPHVYADFAERCIYQETSPESHFKQRRICSLATPDGRVSLSEMKLITTRNGERLERELTDEAEYAELLKELFGIVIPSNQSSNRASNTPPKAGAT
ncbi:MAG TPA: arylamine N-acetyltransferase [Thermoanaerobaculia bacterium]|jgi:N-hydroxyarylamine O-acetyltransferase|nr:arylamine N-acetyltransferase [Thermoanaerobaculia bacterium]